MNLAPGRTPLLKPVDVPQQLCRVELTGAVRPTNTKHGPRLFVELRLPLVPMGFTTREMPVSFRSHSYVRLCELFGEDCSKWKGRASVRVVADRRDRKSRVEIV